MLEIEQYQFGKIVIDGKVFTNDVIVCPERVIDNWWRKEGHNLCKEDLEEILDSPPDVLIIGTGHSGAMHVPESLIDDLMSKGIKVIVERTPSAVDTYNRLHTQQDTVAALHLTC